MFKKLLLTIAFSLVASSAFAVCGAIPLTIKDASAATQNISSATAADGNCKTYIDADTASQIHTDLTASIPAGANLIGKIGIDQTTPGTTNAVAVTAGTNRIGYVTDDPCSNASSKLYKPISITTATTTNIITGTAAKIIYICQLFLTSAAADNIAVIEGTTGATCGAGTAGVIGGTTATNGLNFAANGGVSIGNGAANIARTATVNNDICLITSASTPLAGGITYAVQ